MEDAQPSLFDPKVEFPQISRETIPDDAQAITIILRGQKALWLLYERLDQLVSGEAHCLIVLLSRDWARHFRDLIRTGEAILASLNFKGDKDSTLPPAGQVAEIARKLEGATPKKVLEIVSGFASRTLVCSQLVPWVAKDKEVFDLFQSLVEAEDHHLALQLTFSELLQPLDPV